MIKNGLITLVVFISFLLVGCGKNEVKVAEEKPNTTTEVKQESSNTQVADKDVQTVEFKCAGMTCGSCEDKISKEVKKISGVKEVIADSKTKTAKVMFAAGQTSSKEIESVINKAGFNTEAKSDVKNDTPSDTKDKKSCGTKNCCKEKK